MEAADRGGARPVSGDLVPCLHLRGDARGGRRARAMRLRRRGLLILLVGSSRGNEDAARVEALGEVIALAEPPSGPRPATERARRRALMLAAHYAPLWMMPLGFEAGFEAEVAAVNARRREQPELFAGPPARLVSAPGAEVTVLARGSRAAPRLVLALNPSPDEASALPAEVVLPGIGGAGGTLVPLDEAEPAHGPIAAGGTFEMGPAEARAFRFAPAKPIRRPAHHAGAERA